MYKFVYSCRFLKNLLGFIAYIHSYIVVDYFVNYLCIEYWVFSLSYRHCIIYKMVMQVFNISRRGKTVQWILMGPWPNWHLAISLPLLFKEKWTRVFLNPGHCIHQWIYWCIILTAKWIFFFNVKCTIITPTKLVIISYSFCVCICIRIRSTYFMCWYIS